MLHNQLNIMKNILFYLIFYQSRGEKCWIFKQLTKYSSLATTRRGVIVLVYTTQIQKYQFISFNIPEKGLKLNSLGVILSHQLFRGEKLLLLTSKLANQCTKSIIHLRVWYILNIITYLIKRSPTCFEGNDEE